MIAMRTEVKMAESTTASLQKGRERKSVNHSDNDYLDNENRVIRGLF